MAKKGFIKSWLILILIIPIFISLTGVGIIVADKNGIFAQAQNQNPSPIETSEAQVSQRDISKNVPQIINLGDNFNINIGIPGMEDNTGPGGIAPADIMVLIDNSESMERKGCTGTNCWDCQMTRLDGNTSWNGNRRICYAKEAAMNFILKAMQKNLDWKIGYQQFSDTAVMYPLSRGRQRGFFMPLKDIRDQNNVNDLVDGLHGFADVDQTEFGSAMGLGLDLARSELVENGRPGVNKYVIIISDGAERPSGSNPSLSGFAQQTWPEGWPPNFTGTGESNWMNICGRLESRENWDLKFIDPRTWEGAQCQDMIDRTCQRNGEPAGCILSCKNIIDWAGHHSDWINCMLPRYEGSPADMAQKNGVKVMTIGYYGGFSNTNRDILMQIAKYLYSDDPGGSSGYFEAPNPQNLGPIFDQIIRMIGEQNIGAPFTIHETMAPGATVTAGNIEVVRDGVTINPTKSLGTDPSGRQTITINIESSHYGKQKIINEQTFEVRIKNVRYTGGAGCFDADQNYDISGNELNPKPSYVTWTFPFSGNPQETKPMPAGKICVVPQYTGDVYGQGINEYLFPGIDVTVSDRLNNSRQAVWSLSDYLFQPGTSSRYANFRNEMAKVEQNLMKRRQNIGPGQVISVFTGSNPNPDIYPDGQVYYVNNNVTISGSVDNIGGTNKKATIMINGDLTISADHINKQPNSNNNILLYVLGDHQASITGGVGGLDVAIVAPEGRIVIADTSTNVRLKGLYIARDVALRANNTRTQTINYDSGFALYPPPGLASILEPIFKEVVP